MDRYGLYASRTSTHIFRKGIIMTKYYAIDHDQRTVGLRLRTIDPRMQKRP